MVLRGLLPRPKAFIVLNANPGMENSASLELVEKSATRCAEAGIPFITAEGPNLYSDLLNNAKMSRLDNPPYWTKNRTTGKRGRLSQGCTQEYKIAPMRRALRLYLHRTFGVSLETRRPPNVEMWIGFTEDETKRIKPCDVKYVTFRYPLIELGYNKEKLAGFYLQHSLETPARSVCNACFSNGLAFFEDMYWNRDADWEQAVAVDESVRDLRHLGITDEVFVSGALVPLKDLPKLSFLKDDQNKYKEHRCNSGVCFL